MKWVGLTGGIATGKSTIAKMLRDIGVAVVDADLLARDVTKPGSAALKEIAQAFGREMVGPTGELDRSRLGKLVFSQPEKLKILENILHPKIQELRAQARRQLEQAGHEIAFYDVPLLFEKNMQGEFDAVVLVYAKPDAQKARLKERDHLSDVEVEQRLKSQMPIDDKLKLANFVIFNQSSMADLKANLLSVLGELAQKF